MLSANHVKGDGTMKKLALVVPVGLLIAAFYLLVLTMQPGETVQLIPGHEIPDRLGVMLGAIGILGAIVVGAEALREKKLAQTHDTRRVS
jgi:hypothetical protein